LGDHYNKRWVIIIGSLIGVAGGIFSGRAHSIGQIIAGQVLFGISCSTNASLTISCVSEPKNFL
jgi:MFS family permease